MSPELFYLIAQIVIGSFALWIIFLLWVLWRNRPYNPKRKRGDD